MNPQRYSSAWYAGRMYRPSAEELAELDAATQQPAMRREAFVVDALLRYGCTWHGTHESDGCCECDMRRFYREQPTNDTPEAAAMRRECFGLPKEEQ